MPRKKIDTDIKLLSLNKVLAKQTGLLEQLLACNHDLLDVLIAISKEREKI